MSGQEKDVEMEAGPSGERNPRKRTVDADDNTQERIDPKRPRVNLNDDMKIKILKYIIQSGATMYSKLRLCEQIKNITIAHQIMSALQHTHNLMRKMANEGKKTHAALALNATITTLGDNHIILYEEVRKLMLVEATNLGLNYTASNRADNNHWYGIANPIFALMSSFKMRHDEIRLGVSKIPVAKKDLTTSYIEVAQYGLSTAHHILLEGATYKPERRSAIAQTLGPMTAILAAHKSKIPYKNKWMEAVKRDLAHVPNVMQLISAMEGKKCEEIAPALSALADCLLIAGSRNAQRAFFPLNFLILVTVGSEFEKACKMEVAFPKVRIEDVDFSGKGMWLIYKACMEGGFTLETSMDDMSAGQMVYHSIFGTQNEDFGVLSAITNTKTWKTRSEIAGGFKGANKALTEIKLPKQALYAKLAQANMTGHLTTSSFQVRCKQIFAGKRAVKYIDSFDQHMESDNPESTVGSLSLAALTTYYKSLKVHLNSNRDKHPIHGTVAWRTMRGLSATNLGP